MEETRDTGVLDPLLLEPHFPDFPATVPRFLEAGRRRFGDHDCVVTPDARLTFADLDEQSRRLAAFLVQAGVSKGSRVGILFPNGIEWVLTWAAAARVGAVTIPVNTFYKAPELGRFLRHADVQYLVTVGGFLQHDYLARLETLAPDLQHHQGPGPLWLQDFPQLRRILLWGEVDPARPWAEPGVGAAIESASDTRALGLIDALGEDVAPGDELFVTYTSGSTGEPKGVIHSHGGSVRHAFNLAALSGIDEASRIWTPMPLCWVGGFEFSLLRALVAGGCFLTQAVFEPGAALKMFQDERVTNVSAWPGISKTLCEHPDFPNTDLSSLRTPTSLYEAMPLDRRPPDPGLAVSSLGMSETCGPHTFWTRGEEVTGVPERYRGAFGHEVPGTQHRIVDADSGRDLPEGEEGEVLVRGYSLMLGLYKHERSEVFDADGWYHTGDRGYFRDGWFFFTGRQTDLIKTGGSNVAPAEVERCLIAYDDVKLAFVVGVPDPVKGQVVVALLVPSRSAGGGGARDSEAIRAHLKGELSSYKVPAHVLFITDEQVPWLVSQKVDRRALLTLAEKLLAGAGQ
ncbi:MAG TPA: class I adenylate-forming enzyme family protein [Acidimicrobiales bacterium]|nr:class I adenylate-forming enzyme family protein [Acidimicrobiales bacterium]